MYNPRSMLMASAALSIASVMFAAPGKSGGAPAPAPKPAPAPAPAVETGKPIPEGAAAAALVPQSPAAAAFSRSFEIEDDIALPEKRVGVKGESIYPFDKIAEGQSFFVPATDAVKEPWKTLTSMASRMSRDLHPKKFVTARQPKNGVDGVRIWRAQDSTEPLAPPRVKRAKAEAEPAAEVEATAEA